MSGDVTLGGATTDTVSDVCTLKSLTVSGDTTLLVNVVWGRRAPTLSRCGAPVTLGDASAVVVREGFSHGDGAPTPSVERPLSSTAASICDEFVAMAGSLSVSGDVTLESDGSDIVTINGVFSVASTLIVSGGDVEHGHGWSRQRGNRLRDDLRFDNFIDALTVTGAAG